MQTSTVTSAFLLAGSLLFSPAMLAQHATAFDIIDGQQAYQQVCANCHGPDGNLIANVDLGHGNFRQPYSDEQLVDIILKGIADTPMPPNPNMNAEQAAKIVAWLRSLALENGTSPGGDAIKGQALFADRGECLSCHAVAGVGSVLGPELSRIGAVRTAAELEISLLEPAARVLANHRFYTVVTRSGLRSSGRLLNHDAFTVQLLDSEEKLRSFMKEDLLEYGFSEAVMPVLGQDFTQQDRADLVAYLVSLRGTTP